MRRFLFVSLIVIVLGGIVGGIWLYVRYNSDAKVLARAELALRANQPSQAMELSGRYIAKNPSDWRGYFAQARAMILSGENEKAREVLRKAASLDPAEIAVPLTLAGTYESAAGRLLAEQNADDQTTRLGQAIDALSEAVNILSSIPTPSKNVERLDVRQALGLAQVRAAEAQARLAACLEREAKIAEAANSVDIGNEKRKAAQEARKQADRAESQALAALRGVVEEDATRDIPAEAMILLAGRRADHEAVDAAHKAIWALEMGKRPPRATATLLATELDFAMKNCPPDARREKMTQTAKALDELIQAHPDQTTVGLIRTDLAIRLGDLDTAQRVCDAVLQKEPRQGQARFYHARILMARGHAADAERELMILKSNEYPNSPEILFLHAEAALAVGKTELAKESLRRLTKLLSTVSPSEQSPDIAAKLAEAHRILADSLLKQGFSDQALVDAKGVYEAQPDEPAAIGFYMRVAQRCGQTVLVRQLIDAAMKKAPPRPEMMLVAVEGYQLLGETETAKALAKKISEMKGDADDSRLAVAKALQLTGNASEAEAILAAMVAQSPQSAQAQYELARFYTGSKRNVLALEHYRAAARLSEQNTAYRMGLAQALMDAGMLDESLAECRKALDMEPGNYEAVLLEGQIKILRGEPVDMQRMQSFEDSSRQMELPLALAYFGREEFPRCIELCKAALAKNPSDLDALWLLGQADLRMGQEQPCLQTWTSLLQLAPDRLPTYAGIAGVLARHNSLPQVAEKLRAIPGANRNLADLTMGMAYRRAKEYPRAAEVMEGLAQRTDAPEDIRNQAGMERVTCLTQAGQFPAALAELDRLSTRQGWKAEAMLRKAQILAGTEKTDQALSVLADLRKLAASEGDFTRLLAVADLCARMKKEDVALEICAEAQKLAPRDITAYELQAVLLYRAGKRADALACYEQAIRLMPSSTGPYLGLSRIMDQWQDLPGAIATLDRMKKLGPAAEAMALSEQAALFSRYGLEEQATQCLSQLVQKDFAGSPNLKYSLGRAFAVMRKAPQAQEELKAVPPYSAHYVEAQCLLAEMADTTDAALAILDSLKKERPGDATVVDQEMSLLARAGQNEKAIQAFQDYLKALPPGRDVPSPQAYRALQMMTAGSQVSAAAELGLQMARRTGLPVWRNLAALLNGEGKPELTDEMLGDVSAADPHTALLGVSLCAAGSPKARAWADRFAQIEKELASGKAQAQVPPGYRLLVALATRDVNPSEIDMFASTDIMGRGAAAELIAAAKGDSRAPARAQRLIKASLALEMGLLPLSRAWAMEVLKDNPTCQWAAGLVLQSQPDKEALEQVLRTLRPEDSTVARLIRASLLLRNRQFKEATDIFRQVAAVEKNNTALLLNQALSMEGAGQFEEALQIYEKVLAIGPNARAANSAAYMVTLCFPGDKAKLEKAHAWAQQAVDASPDNPSYHDTRGWIACLLGRSEEACSDLRQAVKGQPQSPEAHYHVGMAEAAAGNKDLARGHWAAAVALAEQSSKNLSPAAEKAGQQAQAQLSKTK